jgi:protein ImuB
MWWVGASGFGGRGGERELAYALRRIAARWHPRPRVAIADSCVAARAATWAGTSFQQGDDRSLVCIVPHGHDAGYLAPAPLALVPMGDELRLALQALGLRTVGSFAALSAEDVERRWGAEGLQAWRLTHGEDHRRPVLARVPDLPVVDAELPMPATTIEPILFLVRAALDRLTTHLAARGQAVAALSITLSLDDRRGALPANALARAHTVTREIRLARPVARSTPLFERCRALLDTWPLTAPAIGVGVSIVTAAPLSGEQGDLLNAAWRDAAAVDAALARLRAELGPNVVVKPVARDAHVPDRAGAWIEEGTNAGSAPVQSATTESAAERSAPGETATAVRTDPAIRLLESPESVFVVCDDGVPRVVTWRGRRLTIERAVGPERLSGDWWDDGYRRDYWRCESAFGDFVLYLDRMDDQWWVQGWFD